MPLAGTQRIQKGQDKTKSKPGLNVDSMGDVADKNVAHRAPTTGSVTDRGPQLLPFEICDGAGVEAGCSLPVTECSPRAMTDGSYEYRALLCCQLGSRTPQWLC